jgi:lactoylglutathione lyase
MEAHVRARLVGINHVALEVGDLEEALEFYGSVFDLTLRGAAPGMAFVDIGDQFLALASGREQPPDGKRHFGLVVDSLQTTREALERAGTRILPGRGLSFLDPWGNHVQVVEYSDVQFTKTPEVLNALGLSELEKSDKAKRELAEKGLLGS